MNRRGGEKVLDALCRLLPDADVFTLFCDPETLSPEVRRASHHHLVSESAARATTARCCRLMPMALESFDLRGYDLVVSSESGPAKGVITSSTTRHVCYCHTPMRYLWDLYPGLSQRVDALAVEARADGAASPTTCASGTTPAPRAWTASSPTADNVQARIWKTYRRESDVVHPPVEVDSFYWKPSEDYFLVVSELVAYKRIDSVVRWFSRRGRRLKIVGDGPEYRRLRRSHRPTSSSWGA